MKAVCQFCGGDTISLNVEVESTGYRDITATYEADGTLKVSEGHTEKNYDGHEVALGYECADCNAEGRTLEDLVCPPGAVPGGGTCACGHSLADHPPQRDFDRKLYTSGRRSCTAFGCRCWEFETDPALASVVAA